MRILVLGARGQVARSLAAAAPSWPGISLACAGRSQIDLMQPGQAQQAITLQRPDVVINAAAYTAVDRAESEAAAAQRLNADAVGEVAEACRHVGARLVHLSTDYVFPGNQQRPWLEDDPTEPLNVYGRTKLAGELIALAAHADTVILRTSWVYGAHPPNFVCTMLRHALGRSEITVVDDQIGCPTAADEVARACLTVAVARGSGTGGVFHMAQPGPVSWAGFAREIMAMSARLGGPCADIVPIPTSAYPTPARRPAYSVLDTSRLTAAFGFQPAARAFSLEACMDQLARSGWALE